MVYGPERHHRGSIRLQGYDYTQAGAYFVTICARNRECLFGDVTDGEMRLNTLGRIVAETWNTIPQRFTGVELDEFIVMPNHIHGIIVIVGAPLAGAQKPTRAPLAGAQNPTRAAARAAPTVGNIVGAFKSLCMHHGLAWIAKNDPGCILGKLWQRNYFEHVIRNEDSLRLIREYIINNPAQWDLDRENPALTGDSLVSESTGVKEPWCV